MKSTSTVFLVFALYLHLLGLGVSQTLPGPSSASNRVDTADLLETAHGLLVSVPADIRIDALAELVTVASKTKNPHTNEWLQEVEQLAEIQNDSCRRARYQARIIEVVNASNSGAALKRLAQANNACSEPLANAAATVFGAAIKECGGKCIDDVLAAAEHLGQLGSYPFTAMVSVAQQVGTEGEAARRIFMTTLSHYKRASNPSWRAHRSFLSFVERHRSSVSREVVIDAVSLAITRIRDQRDGAGLQYVSVLESGATRQHSDRDGVLRQLYGLAKNVDENLANKVIEQWPDVARHSPPADAKASAGVAVGGSNPLPRSAELTLGVERLKPRLGDVSADEIKNFPVDVATRIALLSLRASQVFQKDPAAASRLLGSAARELDKLEDRMEQVLVAPYLVEAAVKCEDSTIASKTAELQFDNALTLLRELRREKATPLIQTPVYWPLKQTVMALRSRELAMPPIDGVRDDELKSRLLVALAESLSRKAR